MSTAHLFPLEVTQAVLNSAKSVRFQFGADTALVAVQHILLQTVDLFKTIGALGLNLKNSFVLGKVYSNNEVVVRALAGMGVTVVASTMPAPGEFHSTFDRDVEQLWKVAAAALAQRRIKRLLVLDDAGVCITSVPTNVLERYSLCGVEQTSQGIFLFEKTPPPFAVVSWARSAVKLEAGGPIFSQCFVEKMNRGFLHGASLRGAQVGIIGLGSIGKAVANLIVRQSAEVFFYDANPSLQFPRALTSRVIRLDSLEELMRRCNFVIGCSGRHPFEGKWPLTYRPGINLLSASGGDQEFRPIIKDLDGRSLLQVDPETWDLIAEDGPSGPIRIAYLGYPYNFVSRSAEAVPTRIVQLETGGLLTALIQARLYLELCETGRAQNSGVHRVSPQAQRYVYDKWMRTMMERNINVAERFAYDPAMLSAAQHEGWFVQNSEPQADAHSEKIEQKMIHLIRGGYFSRAPGQAGA